MQQEPMMAELRRVDPNSLVPNPDNPRRTAVPKVMDDQLVASVVAVGILQLPLVREKEGRLEIIDGHRRKHAAIAAGFATIDVVVCDADEAADPMRSFSANLIRASMTSVDIWRATATLEAQGWTEQAIADALALPVRTIKRLKLLAHLHPAMLDVMATGNMPNEDQLRTITAASRDEQAQVWKKYKPKKGHDVAWYEIARALSKRRIPFSAAKFDDALAQAYGVVWEDDLFAPAGEDGRYTTNVEGFFGAQQEWLQDNLPERGTLLPSDEYGRYELPKKAEHVYGKPGQREPCDRHCCEGADRIQSRLDHREGLRRAHRPRLAAPAQP
jgi:ParB family transcriptional regulator, chromosome partitioning protein